MKDDAETVAVSVIGELRGVMREIDATDARIADLKRQLDEQRDALRALSDKRTALLGTLDSALWNKP